MSSGRIVEVPDQERLNRFALDRLVLLNKLDLQKTRQTEIIAWGEKQAQEGWPQSRDTAQKTHAVYQREVERLSIEVHNLDMQLMAYSAAFPEEAQGGQSSASTDVPPVQLEQRSEFVRDFYQTPLKVLVPEATDEAPVEQGVSSMARLARTGDVLISDADSTVSELTEQ